MKSLLKCKSLKLCLLGVVFVTVSLTFSSCMVMAPGHFVQASPGFNNNETIIPVDPVCGKKIDNIPDELSYHYHDQYYYFHTVDCRNHFVETPEAYIQTNHDRQDHNGSRLFGGMGGITMGAMMLVMLL